MQIHHLMRVLHRLSDAHEPDACWPWPLGRQRGRYGRLSWRGAPAYAHRVVYETLKGDPSGLQVCHHCDNPICVNPSHLFLGTMADNQRDKVLKGRTVNPLTDAFKQRTHCPKGHPYDERNTLKREYTRKDGRVVYGRACRACLRAWANAVAARKRAQRKAP